MFEDAGNDLCFCRWQIEPPVPQEILYESAERCCLHRQHQPKTFVGNLGGGQGKTSMPGK
ncbi:MAG: hypothetical protein PHV61_08635 [Limnochordia bacterium]|nr:hypothetical protein [Limnochordia bacterium]MDD4518699.1 hypothetical protein [Limnochordia bacterium]